MAEKDRMLERLRASVRSAGSAAVAFSGGADSTLVAKVAKDELGDSAVAVTVDSPLMARDELRHARASARRLGIRHVVATTDPLGIPGFAMNPTDRCYICKLATFGEVRCIAGELGLEEVLDGSNADDQGLFRPGSKARDELGVRSPLAEAGLRKSDVVRVSKALGLPAHAKAPNPCLATRIPYGERLTPELLARIERAEGYLARRGFDQVRVRAHGDVARIEVPAEKVPMLSRPGTREAVVRRLKNLGFAYVAVDLEGYRSGSMDEVIGR